MLKHWILIIWFFASGNVIHSEGDPSKAEKELGWKAQIDLELGIEKTWGWFQKNNPYQ